MNSYNLRLNLRSHWFHGLCGALLLFAVSSCGDDDEPVNQTDTGTDLADTLPDGEDESDPNIDPDLEDETDLETLEETPGTIEELGREEMALIEAAHNAAAPTEDEIVIYYYRADGDYEPWGVWLWAFGSGNGADHWEYTQDFEVVEGVAYLKFDRSGDDIGGSSPLNDDNVMGIIIRLDSDWIKDGAEDRLWDADVSNELVIFSGDQRTYPYGAYVPTLVSATMATRTTLTVELSGRHALEGFADDNGFTIYRADTLEDLPIADVQNAASLDDRTLNYANELLITLDEEIPLGPMLMLAHPSYLQPLVINNQILLLREYEALVPEDASPLGASFTAGSGEVTFHVWSPLSESVVARLYTESGAESPDYELTLTLDEETGVWTGTFDEVDPDGFFYDYLITNSRGENPALDPYARSMDAYRGEGGSGRAAIVDLASEAAMPEGWDDDEPVTLAQREDAIIYEIHVRDFTIAEDAEVTAIPGTYLAFIEKLPYLQDLGITHIQLQPVLNFYYTDETDQAYEGDGAHYGNNYNWGYDPHNYFTPEGWYSTDPADPYARVLELRTLIEAIHEAGMGVLLDVVYNHVGNSFVFQDLVPNYYFRTNANGTLTSASGCGNDLASTHIMVRRLIVDSAAFWCGEYHIDGFRFDLMGLTDTATMEAAYEACSAINPDVLFEGEGWRMYNGPAWTRGTDQDYMDDTDSISVFNDEIRNMLKAGGMQDEALGFLTGRETSAANLLANLLGQPATYPADDPGDSMAYIAAHDNLTLHDNIAHNLDLDDTVLEERQEIIDRIRLGNFLILTGQSIAFLHGGQERARTKPRFDFESSNDVIGNFVSNSYDAADNINQFPWTLDEPAQALYDFTRGLIHLRRSLPILRLGDATVIDGAAALIEQESLHAIGYTLTHDGTTAMILTNADVEPVTFTLDMDLTGALVVVDRDEVNADGVTELTGVTIDGTSITLDGLTPALLLLNE